MNKRFVCANCHQQFHSQRSNKEANAEAEHYFDIKNASRRTDFIVVCDDCFQLMHPDKYPELVEETKQILRRGRNRL